MGLTNFLGAYNASQFMKQGRAEPVVTLTTRSRSMPSSGKKLIAMGYKVQSVACDPTGLYNWVFVLSEYAA